MGAGDPVRGENSRKMRHIPSHCKLCVSVRAGVRASSQSRKNLVYVRENHVNAVLNGGAWQT